MKTIVYIREFTNLGVLLLHIYFTWVIINRESRPNIENYNIVFPTTRLIHCKQSRNRNKLDTPTCLARFLYIMDPDEEMDFDRLYEEELELMRDIHST